MLCNCMLSLQFSSTVSNIDLIYLSNYITYFDQYLKDSIDQIVNFFESNVAVSQTIALETAAAVQVCF